MRCPSSVCRPSSLLFTFSTSPLKLPNGIQRNLTGSKISTSFTKFVFFGPIGKIRWPPWPLIGWDIFDFSSKTAERNSTKLDRKQDLNVLYQVCVFRADQYKTRWPPWLLIGWDILDFSSEKAELHETCTGSKMQRPLPSLCPLGLWFKCWNIFDFSETAERIQRNLTGSKFNVLLQSLCFFGPIGKTRWPPWPLIGWDIFDFSSETAERNLMKLDRKQDINVLYQVCVFQTD